METIWANIAAGLRLLRTRPTLFLAATATLAIGVGANVAVFSVARALLVPHLPYLDPSRLVQIWGADSASRPHPLAADDYAALRDHTSAFAATAACSFSYVTARGSRDEVGEAVVGRVTKDFFLILGVSPVLGRTIDSLDFGSSASSVVISDGTWRTAFGRSANVIGSVLWLNTQPRQVIGVMPADFMPRCAAERGVDAVWVADVDSGVTAGPRPVPQPNRAVFARLRDSVSAEEAQRQVNAAMAANLPRSRYRNEVGRVEGIGVIDAEDARSGLFLLQGAATVLLLIASVNLASLLLILATTRGPELALRLALGASRYALVRQLIGEALLIAIAGGILGTLIAVQIQPVLLAAAGRLLPPWIVVRISVPELLFGLCVGISVTVGSASVPALIGTNILLSEFTRSGEQIIARRTVGRARSTLVAIEVALSVVGTIGAALLVTSFVRVMIPPMGFRAQGLVVADIVPPPGLADRDAFDAFKAHLIEAAERHLGGVDVAFANEMPTSASSTATWTLIAPDGTRDHRDYTSTIRAVSRNYFDVLQVPLLRGSAFTTPESSTRQRVAMISSDFDRRYAHGRNLLGFQITYGTLDPFTIRGVVSDTRGNRFATEFLDAVYVPLDQVSTTQVAIGVRSDHVALVDSALRTAAREVNLDSRVVRVVSLDAELKKPQGQRYFYTLTVSTIAGASFLLTVFGIATVTASVTRGRAREFGLRLALGAGPTRLVAMIVGQGLTPAFSGVVAGLLLAWILTSELRRSETFMMQLYQTSPHEFGIFAAASIGVLSVSTFACWLAARPLAGADPAEILKRRGAA